MIINTTKIEVRYQETDQMGVVYHANYLVWFEIGRTKYIEQLGFKYTEMEEQDLVSPVIDAQLSFKKPAKYGDDVTIETWLDAYDGLRTTYAYQITNGAGDVLVTGKTVHALVTKERFRPIRLGKVNPKWDEFYHKEMAGRD